MRFNPLVPFVLLVASPFLGQVSAVTTPLQASAPNTINHFNATAVVQNANHVFNAIHSALRQWGSSLNHNGMSAFIARVPAGVEFYHGTRTSEPVTGLEWLAFEPEHALQFAGMRPGGAPPGMRPPGLKEGDDNLERTWEPHWLQSPLKGPGPLSPPLPPPPQFASDGPATPPPFPPPPPPFDAPPPHFASDGPTPPLGNPPGGPPHGGFPGFPTKPGYLHTYVTKHELRLLYVDGMSAGKTQNGTLDLQDLVLRSLSRESDQPLFSDWQRARDLCALAELDSAWAGRIHGIVRMEAGFEVILCDFTAHLEVVRITRAGLEHGEDGPAGAAMFAYFRAVLDRARSIGGRRALLDFDRFVTAYSFGLDLFLDQSSSMPRLVNASKTELARIKDAVTAMVLAEDNVNSHDWQGIVDLIVTRYSGRLQYMVSEALTAPGALWSELELTVRMFIDYDARNVSAEVTRCTYHFMPELPSDEPEDTKRKRESSLAAVAIIQVSQRLCSTLFDAFKEKDENTAREKIKELINWLQWTSWKECQGCGHDELCAVPMWPWGAKQDHEKPSCANATAVQWRHGYWGGHGPGGGHPPFWRPGEPRNEEMTR